MSAVDSNAVALEAWGGAMPDWVKLLADECSKTSQNKVALRLKRSASLVSNVLRNKYEGDMLAVEEVVRGVYMATTTNCPALGEISTAACRDWMRTSSTFSNENSERVRMYRACRSCPRSQKDVVK